MNRLIIEFNSNRFITVLQAARNNLLMMPVASIKHNKKMTQKTIQDTSSTQKTIQDIGPKQRKIDLTPEEIMFVTGADAWIDMSSITEIRDKCIIFNFSRLELQNKNGALIIKIDGEEIAQIPLKDIKSIEINSE